MRPMVVWRSLLPALAAIGVILVSGILFAPVASAGTDDYPAQWKNAPQDSVPDQWGEWNRECTSFVSWRLHSRNAHFKDIPAGGGSSQGDGVGGAHFFGKNQLAAGDVLQPNQYIASSDLQFALILQSDGNLVLYGHVLWATNTGGHPGGDATVQTDGNFVLYANGGAIWTSYTGGQGSSYLIMQSDGNAVVYKDAGGSTWASYTTGRI